MPPRPTQNADALSPVLQSTAGSIQVPFTSLNDAPGAIAA